MENLDNKKTLYTTNANARIGTNCICPECGKQFIKRYYQQKFCCIQCKDNYHNHTNPIRATRQRDFWKRVKCENEGINTIYMNLD